jgi:hypothetical protein
VRLVIITKRVQTFTGTLLPRVSQGLLDRRYSFRTAFPIHHRHRESELEGVFKGLDVKVELVPASTKEFENT